MSLSPTQQAGVLGRGLFEVCNTIAGILVAHLPKQEGSYLQNDWAKSHNFCAMNGHGDVAAE